MDVKHGQGSQSNAGHTWQLSPHHLDDVVDLAIARLQIVLQPTRERMDVLHVGK